MSNFACKISGTQQSGQETPQDWEKNILIKDETIGAEERRDRRHCPSFGTRGLP